MGSARETSVANDTFAKLLRAHAARRGRRPAFRHKDFGLWQTWTWAEVYDETRAIAAGLIALGLDRGETIAIVGANRPKLYWSITAAQMIGAIPVPVYADSVADESRRCSIIPRLRVIVAAGPGAGRQDSVDRATACRGSGTSLYDEPRGLGDYDEPGLRRARGRHGEGPRGARRTGAAAADLDRRIDAGKGADPSVILYTSGTTGRSKGVVLSGERSIAAARDTVAFDKLTERDEVLAYLPLAWVGDHYLNYAQGYVAGFCMACPESAETAAERPARDRPDLSFRPAARVRGAADPGADPDGGRGRVQALALSPFHAGGQALGREDRQRRDGPLERAARLRPRRRPHLRAAQERARLLPRPRRLYRGRGDRRRPLRLLPLDRPQPEAALRADRGVPLSSPRRPIGAVRSDAVGPPAPNVDLRIAPDGEVQFKSPGMFVGYFREPDKTREALTEDGYVRTGDAGFFEPDGQLKIVDRAKDVGRLTNGQMFAPKYIENKLKFFPNIREAVAIGDGRDFVAALINIELASVGNWAERNNVSYASYQELAGHPRVTAMIKEHVDAVNRALSREPAMAGAQIRRFLILPKELDADDGELTRTQKVRRRFIAERYAPLIDGLYSGAAEASISAEITYEDGRKGKLVGTSRIVDLPPYADPKPAEARAA